MAIAIPFLTQLGATVGSAVGLAGPGFGTLAANAVGAATVYGGVKGVQALSAGKTAQTSVNSLTGVVSAESPLDEVGVSGSSSTDKSRAYLASIGPSSGFGKNPNTARSFLSSL